MAQATAKRTVKATKASAKKSTVAKKVAGKSTAAKKTAVKKTATAKKAISKRAKTQKASIAKTAKTARKTVAKKTAKINAKSAQTESKAAELLADFQAKAEQARQAGAKAGLAYLGMYGKAYDFAKDQYEKALSAQAKAFEVQESRFQELVKRGEKVRGSAQARMDDLDLPSFDMADMDADSIKDLVKSGVNEVKSQVETVKDKTDDMVEVATAKFDELKDKMMPAAA